MNDALDIVTNKLINLVVRPKVVVGCNSDVCTANLADPTTISSQPFVGAKFVVAKATGPTQRKWSMRRRNIFRSLPRTCDPRKLKQNLKKKTQKDGHPSRCQVASKKKCRSSAAVAARGGFDGDAEVCGQVPARRACLSIPRAYKYHVLINTACLYKWTRRRC